MERSLNFFISYASRDETFWIDLLKHLMVLRKKGNINVWENQKQTSGDGWDEEYKRVIQQTDIFLVLISPAYLESAYSQRELTLILEKARTGTSAIFPIILGKCNWQASPIGNLQVLPGDGRPLSEHKDLNRIYAEITKEIESRLASFTKTPKWMKAINKEMTKRSGNLTLNDCELTNIPEQIKEMTWLKTLDLSANQIIKIEGLEGLGLLQELDLSSNQISKIEGLGGLAFLEKLDLTANQINKISGLEALTSLEILYLDFNQISKIEGLQGLASLETLNLSSNQITRIEGLQGLTSLQLLYLSSNQFSKIEGLEGLTSIELLDLPFNRISKIEGLQGLTSLQFLYLSSNQISRIEGLEGLASLQELGLSSNQITKIEGLQGLASLERLDLTANQISRIEGLEMFPAALNELYFFNNPIENISAGTFGENDRYNCLGDLKSLFAEEAKINVPEVNLILTGNSDVGKTKFRTYLTKGRYNKSRNSTHGLEVHPLKLDAATIEEYGFPPKTKISIWDFGGQEYFHNTHQLFFNQNAVYIFLWEKATNCNAPVQTVIERDAAGKKAVYRVLEHFDADYWLSNIRHFAPDKEKTAVIVVQNKVDLYQEKKEPMAWLPFEQLTQYGCYNQYHISLEKAAQDDKAYAFDFEKVKYLVLAALRDFVSKKEEGKTYNHVRRKIETIKAPYWKVSDFIDFIEAAKKASLNKRAQNIDNRRLVEHFNREGKMLYPSGLPLKRGNVLFTNPQWLSKRIYTILNDAVLQRNGFFDEKDLAQLVAEKKIENRTLLNEIVALMQQYNIIFYNSKKSQYVAPQYLPEVPTVHFSQVKNLLSVPKLVVKVNGFLPKSVINNLIADYALKDDTASFYKYGVKTATPDGNILLLEVNYSQRKIYVYTNVPELHFLRNVFAGILAQFNIKIDNNSGVTESSGRSAASAVTAGPVNPPPNTNLFISIDDKVFVNWVALWNSYRSPDGDKNYAEAEDGNRVLRKLYALFYLPYDQVRTLTVAGQAKPSRLFISYSSKNTEFMRRLVTHLEPMKRNGTIAFWYDRMIEAGTKWDDSIKEEMKKSDIVVFLLSPDFLATTYIFEHEIPQAIRQMENKESQLFFIELQDCSWKKTVLANYQQTIAANGNNKEVIKIGEPYADSQWMEVITALEDKIAKR